MGSGECTDDCGGHNAGWEHAQNEGLDDCDTGQDGSFAQGCKAYGETIQAKVDDAEEAFKNGDDAFVKKDD